jgi:hypothetical protein
MLPKSKLVETKEARDANVTSGNLPKSFDLPLAKLEALSPRMTAIEFQRSAPEFFKNLSPGRAAG